MIKIILVVSVTLNMALLGLVLVKKARVPDSRLARVNQKIVAYGEILPEVKLKNGVRIQTGTVATLIYNIRLYNAGKRGGIKEEIKLAIPVLDKGGMFDLFSPEQWEDPSNPGRSLVGELAREYFKKKR